MAVDLPQLDLSAGNEAEEQDQRRVLGGKRALGLHAPAEFLVEALDDVRGAQRLPLYLRKGEERQQFGAAFLQTARDDISRAPENRRARAHASITEHARTV